MYMYGFAGRLKRHEKSQYLADGRYDVEKSNTPSLAPTGGDTIDYTIDYTDGSYVDLVYYNDSVSLGGDALMPY
ncbi:hypothetical protein MKZ38_008145 [Zalerion maritima]|uniref:Uncharacterized protein n=1 Tax=Zalerion maritima TaxID=339359 RepID=A0AAD5RL90_9PEZI|nr:hypothetical protein MKZ38_008145 [Zalerion maritima]